MAYYMPPGGPYGQPPNPGPYGGAPYGAPPAGKPQQPNPYGAPPAQNPYAAPPSFGAPYGAPPARQPMPGAPYGAPQGAYGMPPAVGAPIPGYVPGGKGTRPVYPAGMQRGYPQRVAGKGEKVKNKWNPKRERKLHGLYQSVMRDGCITVSEVQMVLHQFKYQVDQNEALQFLYTLDKNMDGIISWEEFRDGVRSFVQVYPKSSKKYKY